MVGRRGKYERLRDSMMAPEGQTDREGMIQEIVTAKRAGSFYEFPPDFPDQDKRGIWRDVYKILKDSRTAR